MNEKRLLITIDGPAGAGKTTVSQSLAKRLGYIYVDTGALYRAVALAAFRHKGAAADDRSLARLCEDLTLAFQSGSQGAILLMDGEDVSDYLRTQKITMLASKLSAKPVVREFLLDVQRRLGVSGGAVFEGRDMGTVVFPHADVKFFLHAEPTVRAARRHDELKAKGETVSFDEVSKTMIQRDRNDSSRALAPLKPAADAICIDSTALNIDQVLERMLTVIGDAQ